MPGLGDSVVLKFIQVGIEPVPGFAHFIENLCERFAVIRVAEPAYVFRKKPLRLIELQHLNAVGIKGSIDAVHALLLTDDAVIVARKAECEGVNGR